MFNSNLEYTMSNDYDKGIEIHLTTQDLDNERILNMRVFHIAPLQSGHMGYSKTGFYLTKAEAEILRDNLDKMLDDGLLGMVSKAQEAESNE